MKKMIYVFLLIILLVSLILFIKIKAKSNDEYKNEYKISEFSQPEQQLLYEAIQSKDVDKVRKSAPITDLNTLNSEGHSLLFAAIFEAIRPILKVKKVEHDDKIDEDRALIIKILVENGADPAIRNDSKTEIRSVLGLMIQAHIPDQIFDAILAGGFDPNYPYSTDYPLIMKLLSEQTFSKLKLLVEKYNAKVYNPSPKNYLYSPIVHAASVSEPLIVLYLLEHGADPYQENLAYMILRSIVVQAERLELQSSRNGKGSEGYRRVEKKLIEYLQIKQILIQKGVSWPPEEIEINKQLTNWEETYQKDIAIDKQISDEYANELNKSQ